MKHARDRETRHNLSVTLNLSHTACAPGEASSVMQRLQTPALALACAGRLFLNFG